MSSLIILDSFSTWDQNHYQAKWPFGLDGTNISASTSYGRTGAGLQIATGGGVVADTPGSNANRGGNGSSLERVGLSLTNWCAGIAIRLADVELQYDQPIIAILDTSTFKFYNGKYYATQVALYIGRDQRVKVYSGEQNSGTLLLDTGVTIRRGVYHFIEWQGSMGASTTMSVKVDGKLVSGTGNNTNTTGTSGCDGIRIFFQHGPASTAVRYYNIDDFYLTDGPFLADIGIEAIRPTADATYSQWTPSSGSAHYPMVSDSVPDDDTTRVTSTAVGDTDTYTNGSLTSTVGTVHAAAINLNHKNAAFDVVNLAAVIRQGGVDYTSTASMMGTVYYADYSPGYLTNPATGNKFTIAEVNAIEFGPKRTT